MGLGGGGESGGFGGLGLVDGLGLGHESEDGEGGLGGVEEAGGFDGLDGADEDAVGGAGDEVADVLEAGERGHGVAIVGGGVAGGEDAVAAAGYGGFVDGVP